MQRMNVGTLSAVLAVILGLTVSARAQAPGGGVTVFEGARLITGNEAAPIENGTLVIQGDRILQAGKAADVSVPAGATRVNVSGKTIMPTVLDTHTHLNTTRDKLIKDLKRRAYYGVSAALSLGTDNFALMDMRQEKIPGAARYFSAGKGITRIEPGRPTFQINSEAEGRKAVQENAARRSDIIKVWVDDRDGKVDKVTPLQYAAIIDEAHNRGLRVTAHIFNMEDAKGLMRAGLDAFAHGVRDRDIDDETVRLFRQRPYLFLTPNLPDRGVKVDNSWLKPSISADEYAQLEKANTDRPKEQAFYGIQARNLNRLSREGVRITMGTDGNRPWAPHEEMADMVTAGMTPMQVIVAATRNSAAFLRVTDAGTLDPGMSADFMVLDANPLDDITNTRKISAVYLHGVPVDRSVPIN
ncbi:MAG TPA: amidohydrolase family protein [Xanthobacteraceae bacterium]|jgi:imidazolonepropionase-like amidohydrolase